MFVAESIGIYIFNIIIIGLLIFFVQNLCWSQNKKFKKVKILLIAFLTFIFLLGNGSIGGGVRIHTLERSTTSMSYTPSGNNDTEIQDKVHNNSEELMKRMNEIEERIVPK